MEGVLLHPDPPVIHFANASIYCGENILSIAIQPTFLNPRLPLMPVRHLLVGVAYLEDGFLGEGLADYLESYGQPVGKSGGDGDGGQAGDVYRQGADVT